ncbi:MAG: FAD-dependent oxidoreductase [Planctomycetaceae bacterium]|nr:FAD-dependent oxidoreductase [Planctomycetaceae bacterium]
MNSAEGPNSSGPVLILGAGVNGLSVARELVLNGVPVVVVDRTDLGGGASAKSSRLIHGGLRYLEYGEFKLVRESLHERSRLLRLAPHYVKPLRLHIPVRRRSGGLIHAALRFVGLGRVPRIQRLLETLRIPSERGLWAARIGLTLYDWIARGGGLPKHAVRRLGDDELPLDQRQYRWLCSYWDAQMFAPERFCVALWRDTQQLGHKSGVPCELLTYHAARLTDGGVLLTDVLAGEGGSSQTILPSMIVNATGAWGDLTLFSLPVDAPRLFGGTRGSHIISRKHGLRQAIGEDGIYAEAADGRLVFILPWGDAVLVGTTDERFEGPPDEAIATPEEIDYLIGMTNHVLPEVGLTLDDVDSHYSGVRPLPYVAAGRTGAISRDHAIDIR